MKELTLKDLKNLNSQGSGPMLSLYLSLETSLLEKKQLGQRWKEMLNKAEFLMLKDYPRAFVDDFLRPLSDERVFLNKLENLDKGFVIFHSDEGFNGEMGFLRVQSDIHDLVVVANSYHVKPLVKLKNHVRGFFIVTMSSRAINVLIENQGQLVRMDSYRNEVGQNSGVKKDSKEFFQSSANELNKLFSAYRLPIVLAGVKNHIGHMKKLLCQSMLLEDSVVGNVEKMKSDELCRRVYEILKPHYRKLEEKSLEELDMARKRDLVIKNLAEIALSAVAGKITKLFVVENKFIWGVIDSETGDLTIEAKQSNSQNDDVLDDICQMVLEKGGDVVIVQHADSLNGNYAKAIVTDKSHLKNVKVEETEGPLFYHG